MTDGILHVRDTYITMIKANENLYCIYNMAGTVLSTLYIFALIIVL